MTVITADAASKSKGSLFRMWQKQLDQKAKADWRQEWKKYKKDKEKSTKSYKRQKLNDGGFHYDDELGLWIKLNKKTGVATAIQDLGSDGISVATFDMDKGFDFDGLDSFAVFPGIDAAIRAASNPKMADMVKKDDFIQGIRDEAEKNGGDPDAAVAEWKNGFEQSIGGGYSLTDEEVSEDAVDDNSEAQGGEDGESESDDSKDETGEQAPEIDDLPEVDETGAQRCKGKVDKGEGRRCKNYTRNENGYCDDHQNQAGAKESMMADMMAMVAECMPKIGEKCYKVEFDYYTGDSIGYGDIGYGGSAYEKRYTSVLVDAENEDVACTLADGYARDKYGDSYSDLSAHVIDEFDSYEDYQAQYPYSSYEKIAFAEDWNVYEVRNGIGYDEFGEEKAKGYDGYYVIRYEDDGGAREFGPYSSEDEAMTVHDIPMDKVVFSNKGATNFATAPRIPDEVDIDNDNADACPLCGDPNFDGEFCNVCGYEEPPEGFDDIELEEPEDYDEFEQNSQDDERNDRPTFDPDEIKLDKKVEDEADDRADESKDVEDEYGVKDDEMQFA